MARIRTIKPELAAHEGLFDLEQATQLPIRFAWCMLFTVADREGRFPWRPRTLKAQILPHDEVDFSRVLDAWGTRGFVVKYRVGDEWYGWIPTFTKHQVINNRESPSDLPSVDDADEIAAYENHTDAHASGTRQPRVDDASATREVHAQGEGKGKEGRERKGRKYSLADSLPTEFVELKAIYPRRAGDQGWPRALHACNARITAGATWDELKDGARRYAAFCKATGKTGTEYVKQAATFFGPDGHYRQPWTPPPTKAEQHQQSNIDASLQWLEESNAPQ